MCLSSNEEDTHFTFSIEEHSIEFEFVRLEIGGLPLFLFFFFFFFFFAHILKLYKCLRRWKRTSKWAIKIALV